MGIREAILQLSISSERCFESGRPLFVAFVDFSKAFEKVNWKIMFKKMVEY